MNYIVDVIGMLPDSLKEQLFRLIKKAYDYREDVLEWGPEFCGWLANMLGHQAVKIFKMADKDTTDVRTQIRDRLAGMFQLGDEWMPKWPLEQP